MMEADELCDRVAIIDQGQVVALDSPAALKATRDPHGAATLEDVFIQLTGYSLKMA
jgi:ABC-2 type transport system ATP-binding protein